MPSSLITMPLCNSNVMLTQKPGVNMTVILSDFSESGRFFAAEFSAVFEIAIFVF